MTFIRTLFSDSWDALGLVTLSIVTAISSFFGSPLSVPVVVVPVLAPTTAPTGVVASTSVATATATTTRPKPISIPAVPLPAAPPILAPVPPAPAPIVVPTTPITILPNPANTPPSPSATTTLPEPIIAPPSVGATTLVVKLVPLLSGGNVGAGQSVPVSYVQVGNTGSAGALLKGFWITQNGTAPGESVIALSTIDDRGVASGFSGGAEGTLLFQNGRAFAPTAETYIAPGEIRLFTIRAHLTNSVSPYLGTQLMIAVVSVETTGDVIGQFPIPGTTWTIVQ